MSVIPVGYGQVNWQMVMSDGTRTMEVTMGFRNADDLDADACAVLLFPAWTSTVGNQQSQDCVVTGALVKLGPNDSGPTGLESGSNAGGLALNSESAQVAAIGRKATGFGGRWNRGRMFIPGVPESLCTAAGFLSAGYIDDLGGVCGDLLAEMNTASLPAVLLHGPGHPHSADVPHTITGITIEALAATQRRRIRG